MTTPGGASTTASPDASILRAQLGLLTEDEVAAIAGVDRRTVQAWRVERTGPPFTRIGRKVFYRLESLQRWLAQAEEETQR